MKAFVISDGTLLPIDRIATAQPFSCAAAGTCVSAC
jgi:hypothetical protein